jgi:polyisoprenoid-binding protein YceI
MATSGQLTDPELRARLAAGGLEGSWDLDPGRSTVALRSRSVWGLVPVKGAFGTVSGEGIVAAAGEVSGTVTVDSASIDTKMKKRDVHLRSADLFDSDAYPHIIFTIQRLSLTDNGATATGTLRVRDVTRPLTFPVSVSAIGDKEVRIDAEVVIDRSEFGLSWNQMGMASMRNTIAVSLTFVQR